MKLNIIYIFTLVLFTIKLRLKSIKLMLNARNKGFKAFNSLVKLLVKVLINLKGFKIFILYFYFKVT
jgi:hypothetical protein